MFKTRKPTETIACWR